MFQIVIVPANSQANSALSYKSQVNFDIAKKNMHEKLKVGGNLIVQTDDAGQTVEIQSDNISYIMCVDVARQQEFALWAKSMAQGTAKPPVELPDAA